MEILAALNEGLRLVLGLLFNVTVAFKVCARPMIVVCDRERRLSSASESRDVNVVGTLLPRAADTGAVVSSHVICGTLCANGLRLGKAGHSFVSYEEEPEVGTYDLYSVSLPFGSSLIVELIPPGLVGVGASSLVAVLK